MGFPITSFLESDNIDPNLICQVCHEVFDNPSRTPCGHVFCRHCMCEWLDHGNTSCITCREPVRSHDDIQPDRVLSNLIGNLKCRCPNSVCPWRGKHDRREAHLNECAEELVSCPQSEFGCAWSGKRHQLKLSHLQDCPYHACKEILQKQRDSHRQSQKRARDLETRVGQLESIIKSRSPKWLEHLEAGDKVDAQDRFGRWYEATIVSVEGSTGENSKHSMKLNVHFDGWASKHDESYLMWDALTNGLLAPIHTHTVRQRKRAKKKKWRDFEEGDILDVRDTVNKWREAAVVNVESSRIFLHYIGWPNMWDEWIRNDSQRLAPHGSHTLPRTVPAPGSAIAAQPSSQISSVALLGLLARHITENSSHHQDDPTQNEEEEEEGVSQRRIIRSLLRRD